MDRDEIIATPGLTQQAGSLPIGERIGMDRSADVGYRVRVGTAARMVRDVCQTATRFVPSWELFPSSVQPDRCAYRINHYGKLT
jgi:hypothetical protein